MSASVHTRKMRWLRRDAGIRALEEIVVKLTPRLLMVLLDQDELSAEGTLEDLRDRRLRFNVMKAEPGLDVPGIFQVKSVAQKFKFAQIPFTFSFL